MLKVIVNGCNGKMGRVLIETIEKKADAVVFAGIDKNAEANRNEFPVYRDIKEFEGSADVIIDFSRPTSIEPLTQYAIDTKTALVIATTGLEEKHFELLRNAANHVPVFQSANMSLGVNLVKDLCQKSVQVLDNSFDIEIVEFHHNQKVDAPSGTALLLADAINRQLSGKKEYIYGRNPQSGKRREGEIGIHAIRGGTVPGEHRVIFAGPDEIVEIRHLALSRTIFALGALKAAEFVVQQQPELYNMDDLLKR